MPFCFQRVNRQGLRIGITGIMQPYGDLARSNGCLAYMDGIKSVPLAEVIGKLCTVPLDGPFVSSARALGISLGD